MVLTLYKMDASPPARAVMMTVDALNIDGVKFVDVLVSRGEQMAEDYVKINPQHTVPTLKDDDFVVWDSHAIGTYLVTKYGQDDSLYPKDPQKRAVIDQRLHFDSGVLFPAMRTNVFLVYYRGETSLRPENIEMITQSYEFTEKFLEHAGSQWIAGDQLTIADICCVATISSLDALVPIDEYKFPKTKAWLERCSNLEFYKKFNAPGLAIFTEALKAKLGN